MGKKESLEVIKCIPKGVLFDPTMARNVVCRPFGITRCLTQIKNTVIILHGPQGCCHSIIGEMLCMQRKLNPILATNITEKDLILGAKDALQQSLIEADNFYNPDLIVLLTTCSTEIMGEDVPSYIDEVKAELNAKKILFKHAGGFTGGYDQGYFDGYELVINNIMEVPKRKRKKNVNLIGDLRPLGSDRLELIRLIEGIGLEFHCNIVADSTIDELAKAPEAEANLLRCVPTSIKAADLMKSKFGIPYIRAPHPMGIYLTSEWVRRAAEFFNLEKQADDFLKKEVERIKPFVEKAREKLKGKRVVIRAGPGKFVGLTAVALELGMDIVSVYSHTYIKESEEDYLQVCGTYGIEPPHYIMEVGDRWWVEEILPELGSIDLFLVSDGEKGWVYRLTSGRVTGIMCYQMPYYGFIGMKRLTEDILAVIENKAIQNLAKRTHGGYEVVR